MDTTIKYMVDQVFRDYIKQMGYIIVEMESTGNCVYAALALVVKRDMKRHADIRNEVGAFMQRIRNTCPDWYQGWSNEDWDNEVKTIKTDGVCGGKLSMLAASHLYKRTVVVWNSDTTKLYHPETSNYATEINISCHNRHQYNLLIKMPSLSSDLMLMDSHLMDGRTPEQVTSDSKFRECLQEDGYQVQDNHGIPERFSLYAAISFVARGTPYDFAVVRKEVSTYILQHSAQFRGFMERLGHANTIRSIDSHVQNSPVNNKLTICAAGLLYGIRLVIHEPNNEAKVFQFGGVLPKTLHVSLHFGCQIKVLEKLKQVKMVETFSLTGYGPAVHKHGVVKNDSLLRFDRNQEVERPNVVGDTKTKEISRDSDVSMKGFNTKTDIAPTLLPKICVSNLGSNNDNKILGAGRSYVTVLIIVPKRTCENHLIHVLAKERPEFMYIYVANNNRDVQKFRSDNQLIQQYTIFSNDIYVPAKARTDVRTFVCRMIITQLLLTIDGFKWDGIRVIALCKFSNASMAVRLLNCGWGKRAMLIKDDIELIYSNKGSYFCLTCKHQCMFKDKPWHLKLDGFHRLPNTKPVHHLLLNDLSLLETQAPLPANIMMKLRMLYWSASQVPKFQEMYSLLDDNVMHRQSFSFASYLVMIMDGPLMDFLKGETVYQLMKNTNVLKAMYAGKTKGHDVHNHLLTKIKQILTGTCRVFTIREETFNDEEDAESDVSMVVEILQGYQKRQNQTHVRAFVLLNKRAELVNHLPLNRQEYLDVIGFLDSGITIYRNNLECINSFGEGLFSGNYKPVEIILSAGSYNAQDFNEVCHLYGQQHVHESE